MALIRGCRNPVRPASGVERTLPRETGNAGKDALRTSAELGRTGAKEYVEE